jgi:hypothetical protein
MAKKKINTGKIVAIAGGVAAIIALTYIFGFTSFGRGIFFRGQADKAISAGIVEIKSREDIDKYFVFVSPERATEILSKAREKGEEKYIFPQFDISLSGGVPITIEPIESEIEGAPFNFITVRGLPSGIKIYSSVGGFLRGDVISSGTSSYAWVKEIWAEEGNEDVILTYIAAPSFGELGGSVLADGIDEAYGEMGFGDHFANLATDGSLPELLVSGGAQIATAVSGNDGKYIKFDFEDILTYQGRIVMIDKR